MGIGCFTPSNARRRRKWRFYNAIDVSRLLVDARVAEESEAKEEGERNSEGERKSEVPV